MHDIDLDAGLVRHDLRVRGDEAHLVDEDLAPLAALVVHAGGDGDDVRVDAGKHLAAVPALAAGALAVGLAEHGRREALRRLPPRFLGRGGNDIGM